MRFFNREKFKYLRSRLRKSATAPEQMLWKKVRNRQLGVKFRRQHGIGDFIVDFYCSELKLVIELDGDSHFFDAAIEADQKRDSYLTSLGLCVVRYTNAEISSKLEGVLEDLASRVEHLKLVAKS